MARSKETDPDRLVRQSAGVYRTPDDRFEARQSTSGWFLVDLASANELGQPLMLGPFTTLAGVREQLPDARTTGRPTMPKPPKAKGPAGSGAPPSRPARVLPKEPPRTWIDDLPQADASRVRVLMRALERNGIPGAEVTIRADREGLLPMVALKLIQQRLDELLKDVPATEREGARNLVLRTAEVLTVDGLKARGPMPRWALVEIGPVPEPKNRQIKIRR